MRYVSLFSGIGGLESPTVAPTLCCEIDPLCRRVLARRFPQALLHDDVRTLAPPLAEVVAGGWPCQDLSVAGLRRGLAGERSGLFFELLRVAGAAGAHTIVAENVPNLLLMQGGVPFRLVLEALAASGYVHVAWRTLNAREFGLPHQRRRVFLVASRHEAIARALHRPLPAATASVSADFACAGFYWTAGLQSICYTQGVVPTLKVGSSLSIPSPPALHFDGLTRVATPDECLRLQGFDPRPLADLAAKDRYRMAGNAVAAPVGHFAMGSLLAASEDNELPADRLARAGGDRIGPHGWFGEGELWRVEHPAVPLASNLAAFVDPGFREPLSPRAAAGLLSRLERSQKPCPADLRELLAAYGAAYRPGRRRPAPKSVAGRLY